MKHGGPAFPCTIETPTGTTKRVTIGKTTIDSVETFPAEHPGMTLRDYFAAKAMHALLLKLGAKDFGDIEGGAYRWADAMLEERDK